jgi:hypothetical protein
MFTGCGTETTKLQALSEDGRGESSCNEGHNVSVESLTVGRVHELSHTLAHSPSPTPARDVPRKTKRC